jgi:hypothetical protein
MDEAPPISSVVDLIEATVRLEQPLTGRESTVGTGFIVLSRARDGSPRTILITANHVFAGMPHDKASVGFRRRDDEGGWRYAPVSIRIRDADGDPLWTRHPTQDIAAIELPSNLATAALPARELPGERALETLGVQPGDEMMVLGFPHGVAANPAGFPILRSGRVASYPLSPADRYPTYMVDFNVFAGNSGGPVYVALRRPSGESRSASTPIAVTGVLTQQVKFNGDRLAIGNVTQADFITETISLMEGGEPAEIGISTSALPATDPSPASGAPQPSPVERFKEAWAAFVEDLAVLLRRGWIVLRDGLLDLVTPDPRRT